jgi:glycosyltransferase involved in cell wall biosynthesis
MASHPPHGFVFVLPPEAKGKGVFSRYLDRIMSTKGGLVNEIGDWIKPIVYVEAEKVLSKPKLANIDLTFCAQHISHRREPWVADMEFLTALTAYGSVSTSKKLLEKAFSSPYCKAILPWSQMSKMSLLTNLDCSGFKEKIEVVRLAVEKKDLVHRNSTGKIRILFLGTANPYNVPYSFEHKGGHYLIEVYKILKRKYDNLELIVRSSVPSYLRKELVSLEGVKLLENPVPYRVVDNLLSTSDIFFHPAFETANPSVLEAMNHGLPIVGLDIYDYPETIKNGHTGFLISKPEHVSYYKEPFIPDNYTKKFYKDICQLDVKVVNALVEKMSLLIENKGLRQEMGLNASNEILSGIFSFSKRNSKLTRIFESALSA